MIFRNITCISNKNVANSVFCALQWRSLRSQSRKLNDNLMEERISIVKPLTKLLKVAVIGEPNAGKSTFINSLVQSQVCPTSNKVHTTRKKAQAVITEGNTQIIFVDTPGLVSFKELKRYNLEKSFLRDSETLDVDVIGLIHDAHNHWTRERLDHKSLKILEKYKHLPSFLVLNKVDLLKSKRKLLDLIRILTNNQLKGDRNNSLKTDDDKKWRHFSQIFMISSLHGDGLEDIKDYLLKISKPGEWVYDANTKTDQSPQTIIENTVKATLLDFLPQEIPYRLKVELEFFEVTENGTIHTITLVKCPSLRISQLIAGEGDGRLKQMTAVVQRALMRAFQCDISITIVPTV